MSVTSCLLLESFSDFDLSLYQEGILGVRSLINGHRNIRRSLRSLAKTLQHVDFNPQFVTPSISAEAHRECLHGYTTLTAPLHWPRTSYADDASRYMDMLKTRLPTGSRSASLNITVLVQSVAMPRLNDVANPMVCSFHQKSLLLTHLL